MSQIMHTVLSHSLSRPVTFMQHLLRSLWRLSPAPSVSELIAQVEEATTATTLTKMVNRLQSQLWKLPVKEQIPLRAMLINALSKQVQCAAQATLRVEAAGWLRLFVQMGSVPEPTEVFVTLVTAAVRTPLVTSSERASYLKMIFDCFWPFHHPYPAYSWEIFPSNDVFHPLVSLLPQAYGRAQDMLISIFAELPSLDDAEIVEHLLPIALAWASDADAERRRRIIPVLARISATEAQEALHCLQSDPDPLVRADTKYATSYARRG